MTPINCIFTGGSTRGLCYVGVFKAFEENGIEINIAAGSSIGALMMVFYLLGYTSKEMEDEINKLNLVSLFSDFNFNILGDLSFSRGEKYLKWLREKIEIKYYGDSYIKGKMKPVCFKDIEKDIYITAVDVENSQVIVFSKYTTPEMEIAKALRASSSMPALISPFKYDGKILIDGDIARGCPIWKSVPEVLKGTDRVIEFRITGGNKNRISKNPIKMANTIINAAAYIIDSEAEESIENAKTQVVKIDVDGVLFTDFKFTPAEKQRLYSFGYKAFNTFLAKKKCS